MTDVSNEERAFFILSGLPQPIKLKLSVKSSLKNLFTHVPYSHANIVPEFYWKDLKLDGNCCPADYGMLPGASHVHTIDVRLPPLKPTAQKEPTGPELASARVYSSIQPMAMVRSPTPTNNRSNSREQSVPHSSKGPAATAATMPVAATERLIEELQYAVKVHSESALRLNEQLLTTRKDLSETTSVLTQENRKLLDRCHDLEEQIRAKELARQEQAQQSLQTIHQQFESIEQERTARREEVDSLKKLVAALTGEKDLLSARNEELSQTLRERDEQWVIDLEALVSQTKLEQQRTIQLESRLAQLNGVQADNTRLQTEVNALRVVAEREPILVEELKKLRQQMDQMEAHLVQSNANLIALQQAHMQSETDLLNEKRQLEQELLTTKRNAAEELQSTKDSLTQENAQQKEQYEKSIEAMTERMNQQSLLLQEAIVKNAAKPSDAQLHAKIREVVAQNIRLQQLIKQPSSAVSQRALSPTLPPGIATPKSQLSPYRHDVSTSHWNESVQRAASESQQPMSAMERMYPPAQAIPEPSSHHNDVPSVPRMSQRYIPEEPKVVSRQEMRRESVRLWADEAIVDEERVNSIRMAASSPPQQQEQRRAPQEKRTRGALLETVSGPPEDRPRERFSPVQATRAKSTGDIRLLSNERRTDEEGRPAIPRRMSQSPGTMLVEDTGRKQSVGRIVEPITAGGDDYELREERPSPAKASFSRTIEVARPAYVEPEVSPRPVEYRDVPVVELPTTNAEPADLSRSPRHIDTTVLPPNTSLTQGEGNVLVEEDDIASSVQGHVSVASEPFQPVQNTTPRSAGAGVPAVGIQLSPNRKAQSARQAPRPAPEIDQQAIDFSQSRNRFANSEPVVPMKRANTVLAPPKNRSVSPRSASVTSVPGVVPGVIPSHLTPRTSPKRSPSIPVEPTTSQAAILQAIAALPPSNASPSPNDTQVIFEHDEYNGTPRMATTTTAAASNNQLPVADRVIVEPPTQLGANRSIQYDATGVGAEVFGTIGQLFDAAAASGGARTAFCFPSGDTSPPTNISWKKYQKASRQFGRALIGEGFPYGSTAALVGDNSPEWLLSFTGTLIAGCVPVPVHVGLNIRDSVKQIDEAGCAILVVGSPRLLKQFLLVKSQLSSIKCIVVCHGAIPPRVKETNREFVLSFEEFLEKGNAVTNEMVAERDAAISAESCATIVYTSGTTQQPKPVMLSHDNLQFAAWSLAVHWGLSQNLVDIDGNVRIASHESLSNPTFIVTDVILPMISIVKLGTNVVTYFTRTPTNVAGLLEFAKPTVFLASPIVWKGLLEDRLVGLDDCKLMLRGGSSWSHGTCLSLCTRSGITLHEFYSSAETCGIAICSSLTRSGFATCGSRLPATDIRVIPKPGRDEDGFGELYLRGRNVFMGYLKCPSLTQQCITSEGYYSSGDIAQIDDSGLVYFNCRSSDYITNVDGEYVSLQRVEAGIQAMCPCLSTIVAFGSNRKKNICMVSLKTVKDATGKPTDDLGPEGLLINPNVRTVAEARVDPLFQHAIAKAISSYNGGTSCASSAHKVSRFAFFQSEPLYDTEELTVNGKVRRFRIEEKYAQVIEKLFQAQDSRAGSMRLVDSPSANAMI